MPDLVTFRGKPLPLGSSRAPAGVNFAVFSRNGTAVSLVLYPEAEGKKPFAEVVLRPPT